jgi:hypothetical protein
MSKANVGKGKGKERAWLTNARQKPNVNLGGQRHQTGVRKYNKSTYSDVPTMNGATATKVSASKTLKAQLDMTTNSAADDERASIPRAINHEATIIRGASLAEPAMGGAINNEIYATGADAQIPTLSGAISTAVPSKVADSAKAPTMSGAIANNNKVATGDTTVSEASNPSNSVISSNAYTALGSNDRKKKTDLQDDLPADPDHKPGIA